ncbi:botulinum neurotoxin type E variant E11, putative [Babesia ovis]|uniref:Botulinum neurotoxin type E variant E11, putative n=1 Tax=Babesia ovis TaxID=5869 RepID=A0A9W5WUE8_BABOV|nr:botulinum neurotoxin type E variant E11, putative [Babesia ovis]
MYNGRKRQPLGFESLIRLLKKLDAEATVARSNPRGGVCVLRKLRPVVQRATDLARNHPFHAPVVAQQLANVTSKLNVEAFERCATCGGTCGDLHVAFMQCVREITPYLTPKGITQLQTLYSSCRNPQLRQVLQELDLRATIVIYSAVRAKSKCKQEFDAEVLNRISLSCTENTHIDKIGIEHELSKTPCDVFSQLLRDVGSTDKDVSIDGSFWDLNIRDLCGAVTAIAEDSPVRDVLMYVVDVALQQLDAETLDVDDVKSVCRILQRFYRWRYPAVSLGALTTLLAREYSNCMNLKDISCIIPVVDKTKGVALEPLLHRINIIVDNCRTTEAVDVKGLSVIVSQLAKIGTLNRDDGCVNTVIKCLSAFVETIRMKPETLQQVKTFAASVVMLRTLQSLRWSQTLEQCFAQLFSIVLSQIDCWIHIGNVYDLTEMLDIMVSPGPPLNEGKGKYQPVCNKMDSKFMNEVSNVHVEKMVKRLSELHVDVIERYRGTEKDQNGPVVRDLCRFVEIYQKCQLDTIHKLDASFDAKVSKMVLAHHRQLKPIDVVELATYLRQIGYNTAVCNDIVKQAISRASKDAKVDNRQWQRIQRFSRRTESTKQTQSINDGNIY